jgi:putative ABC transport system permease protein
MVKHIFKIIFRNIKNEKINSFVNILGLTLTLSAVFIISIYVSFEFSYDKFHKEVNQIYRLVLESKYNDGEINKSASIIYNVAPEIKDNISGIKSITRIFPEWRTLLIDYDGSKFSESKVAYVDTSFFSVFSFKMIEGDSKSFLVPQTIILTKSLSKKYFGDVSPIHKNIIINNNEYTIVGLIDDFPANSHFSYNMLISFSTIDKGKNLFYEGGSFFTYFKVEEKINIESLQSQINELTKMLYAAYDKEKGNDIRKTNIQFQPLAKIHLYSHLSSELGNNGNIDYIRINILLAIITLLISTINFVNIFTALSEKRATNIGIHKILGASRKEIVMQLFTEIFTITIISAIIAGIFVISYGDNYLVRLMDINLTYNSVQLWKILTIFIIIAIIVSVLSGFYPSLHFSRLSPKVIFTGITSKGINRKSLLYKILICVQFTIAIFLITSLFEINKQINYLKTKDLGFEKNHILVFTNIPYQSQEKLSVIQEEFLSLSFIKDVTISKQVPGNRMPITEFKLKSTDNNYSECNLIRVDNHYLNTLGIKLLQGRNFYNDSKYDESSVIVNESALKAIKTEQVINKQIIIDDEIKTIIGVVKDFHLESLHSPIKPVIIYKGKSSNHDLIVNVGQNFSNTSFNTLKEIISNNIPEYVIDYYILGDFFDNMYKSEESTQKILTGLTYVGLLISFLGIWAFSSLFINKRIKEIGIRKILGANNLSLLKLLLMDFIPWIALALILSTPIAYYFATSWTNKFSYNLNFSIESVIYTIICILTLTLISICYHFALIIKANPSEILKYE